MRNEVETCGRVICRMKEGSNEYKIFLPGPQILLTLHRVSLSAAHITWKCWVRIAPPLSSARKIASARLKPLRRISVALIIEPNFGARRQPRQTLSKDRYPVYLTVDFYCAMGIPFDYAPDRPEHIDTILNGLDRYNPETTTVFQDYVTQQCEEKTYDCYANLALLKL